MIYNAIVQSQIMAGKNEPKFRIKWLDYQLQNSLVSNQTTRSKKTVNDVAAATSKFIFVGPKGLAEWPHTI